MQTTSFCINIFKIYYWNVWSYWRVPNPPGQWKTFHFPNCSQIIHKVFLCEQPKIFEKLNILFVHGMHSLFVKPVYRKSECRETYFKSLNFWKLTLKTIWNRNLCGRIMYQVIQSVIFSENIFQKFI